MSIKKQFLKKRDICKVTFRVSKEQADGHKKAFVVGDFNKWKPQAMDALKDGSFKLLLELETGKEYSFRYVLDKKVWLNEDEADRQEPSEFRDSQNSVLAL
jgi:1,4-alpha-glucan branching enzyme